MPMDTGVAHAPFPETTRVVYQRNPLIEVICQLRFPTILEIGSRDPAEFQEEVRHAYPLYRRDDTGGLPKEVADLLARLPIAKPIEGVTHNFLTEDSTRFISLTREFVAVSEKHYQRWEGFREEIEHAKSALEKCHNPAFYTRVGLRYQDLIDKSELGLGDERWDSLINRDLIGALGAKDIQDHVQQIECVALIELDDYVKGDFVRMRHGLVRPNGREAYLIDADFFTEERSDREHVFGVLDRFNRLAGNLFRWAITPKLDKVLGPSAID